MRRQTAQRKARGPGFTLVEILVTTAMFSMVVAAALGVFNAGSRSAAKAKHYREMLAHGQAALDSMSADIRSAVAYRPAGSNAADQQQQPATQQPSSPAPGQSAGQQGGGPAAGQPADQSASQPADQSAGQQSSGAQPASASDQSSSAAAGQPASTPAQPDSTMTALSIQFEGRNCDTLDLVIARPNPDHPSQSEGGRASVGYYLNIDPAKGPIGLFRRENRAPGDDILSGGRTALIAPFVSDLKLEFYDGADWVTGWQSDTGFPKAVRISIIVLDEAGIENPLPLTTTVSVMAQ
jgi:prepilin-type N-terminal cleavage/methylation domain-containing protein